MVLIVRMVPTPICIIYVGKGGVGGFYPPSPHYLYYLWGDILNNENTLIQPNTTPYILKLLYFGGWVIKYPIFYPMEKG